ncbi:hypothetical protein MPSI1_002458 [Malassezia psittaci]|uniref:Rhodanese domain-containing protein n=1 Tax=Malassezia psittaci TaxID=1821823 RepID=A0AAF0FBB3_9BASI|nr:hypothetical protein MPSI1_002458 [Malassezia psittaci]
MSLRSQAALPPLLLSAKELAKLVGSANPPRILDATWCLPVPGQPARDAHAEYLKGPRIPRALFWDVNKIATIGESVQNLPHMMPSAAQFAEAASLFGISRDTHVVVYDTHGLFSAPRTAFTFAAFGHKAVSVLNGGLPAWIDAGQPIDTETLQQDPTVETAKYAEPKLQDGWIRSFEEMLANTNAGYRSQVVLDARAKARYDGTEPEARPGLASGHIPGSKSLPFSDLLQKITAQDSRIAGQVYTAVKEQPELWKRVNDAVGGSEGIEKLRHDGSASGSLGVSLSCGSGMTASVLWLALQQLGINAAIYDESWMGWGRRAAEGQAPVEKTQSS